MNAYTQTVVIPSDHPCLAGHFPNDPIVPGVLLLQCVANAAAQWLGATPALRTVSNVKFLSPLRPDEPMTMVLEGDVQALRFRCSCDARLLAQGLLTA